MIECLLMNASEIINFSLLFWLHWVFVVARRSFSSCSARLLLGSVASVAVMHGLWCIGLVAAARWLLSLS